MKNLTFLKIVFVFGYAFLLPMCGSPIGPDNLPYRLAPEAVCLNSIPDEWTYLGLREESIRSVLVHPQNPQVIFVGTGFDFSAQRDGKIFRSTDCGKTWEKVYEGGHFRGILLHPEDPYTLFAWNHRPTGALLRSTDGGDTWHLYSEGMHTDGYNLTSVVLINPDNPQIMYAATAGFWNGAVYKSTNGGQRWEGITMNHWPILASGTTAMFMHPNEPDVLLHSADGNGFISRSEDGGDTWDDVFIAVGSVRTYALNPENQDHIVAFSAGEGLLISENRGRNWRVETVTDSALSISDGKFISGDVYIATNVGLLRTNDFENYLVMNEGVTSLTPYVIASDGEELNMYLGHWHNTAAGGGIYVRRIYEER